MDKARLLAIVIVGLVLLSTISVLVEYNERNRCESLPLNKLIENDKCKEILGMKVK